MEQVKNFDYPAEEQGNTDTGIQQGIADNIRSAVVKWEDTDGTILQQVKFHLKEIDSESRIFEYYFDQDVNSISEFQPSHVVSNDVRRVTYQQFTLNDLHSLTNTYYQHNKEQFPDELQIHQLQNRDMNLDLVIRLLQLLIQMRGRQQSLNKIFPVYYDQSFLIVEDGVKLYQNDTNLVMLHDIDWNQVHKSKYCINSQIYEPRIIKKFYNYKMFCYEREIYNQLQALNVDYITEVIPEIELVDCQNMIMVTDIGSCNLKQFVEHKKNSLQKNDQSPPPIVSGQQLLYFMKFLIKLASNLEQFSIFIQNYEPQNFSITSFFTEDILEQVYAPKLANLHQLYTKLNMFKDKDLRNWQMKLNYLENNFSELFSNTQLRTSKQGRPYNQQEIIQNEMFSMVRLIQYMIIGDSKHVLFQQQHIQQFFNHYQQYLGGFLHQFLQRMLQNEFCNFTMLNAEFNKLYQDMEKNQPVCQYFSDSYNVVRRGIESEITGYFNYMYGQQSQQTQSLDQILQQLDLQEKYFDQNQIGTLHIQVLLQLSKYLEIKLEKEESIDEQIELKKKLADANKKIFQVGFIRYGTHADKFILEYNRKALNYSNESYGLNSPQSVSIMVQYVSYYAQLEDTAAAEESAKNAFELAKNFDQNSLQFIKIKMYHILMQGLLNLDKVQPYQDEMNNLLQLVEQHVEQNPKSVIPLKIRILVVLIQFNVFSQGNADIAQCYINDALDLYTNYQVESPKLIALLISYQGYIDKNLANYERSIEYYRESLSVYSMKIGNNIKMSENALRSMTQAYLKAGKYKEALQYSQKCQRIRSYYQLQGSLSNFTVALNQAMAFKGLKRYQECLQQLGVVGQYVDNVKTRFYKAIYYQQLSIVLRYVNQYDKSYEPNKKAIEIYKTLSTKYVSYIDCLQKDSFTLYTLKRYPESKKSLDILLKEYERLKPKFSKAQQKTYEDLINRQKKRHEDLQKNKQPPKQPQQKPQQQQQQQQQQNNKKEEGGEVEEFFKDVGREIKNQLKHSVKNSILKKLHLPTVPYSHTKKKYKVKK